MCLSALVDSLKQPAFWQREYRTASPARSSHFPHRVNSALFSCSLSNRSINICLGARRICSVDSSENLHHLTTPIQLYLHQHIAAYFFAVGSIWGHAIQRLPNSVFALYLGCLVLFLHSKFGILAAYLPLDLSMFICICISSLYTYVSACMYIEYVAILQVRCTICMYIHA